jgi:hypothetical protein
MKKGTPFSDFARTLSSLLAQSHDFIVGEGNSFLGWAGHSSLWALLRSDSWEGPQLLSGTQRE